MILATTNLRAVPLASLGIGALLLRGRDARADNWCNQAVRNARFMLSLFYPDGTYTEGVGYASATIRHLVGFLEAHQRADGSIRWADEANFSGMIRYILTLQAGLQADGTPDVVNFSDARRSSYFAAPAWIARQLDGTPEAGIAQFAVERVSSSGSFLDFLWVEPDRPLSFPPVSYQNVRLDNNWVACRTGWAADDSVVAFRSGGPSNHEHADRNSVFFKAFGERLLTDHPGASYDWRHPKWLLRLTEAHNAVLVNGKGHQYHNGEEGTNPSLAEAEIVRFVDQGDRVWWTSDATQAYAMMNDAVTRIRRTVLFSKPDIVVLLDEVEASAQVAASARFFP
ncbi:MAG: heparinase II/III-family protein, partial [Thermoanaerobaculia bacterium]|nr:heparinase II/III-family protein [Thermoanaerobaculia bacterium]